MSSLSSKSSFKPGLVNTSNSQYHICHRCLFCHFWSHYICHHCHFIHHVSQACLIPTTRIIIFVILFVIIIVFVVICEHYFDHLQNWLGKYLQLATSYLSSLSLLSFFFPIPYHIILYHCHRCLHCHCHSCHVMHGQRCGHCQKGKTVRRDTYISGCTKHISGCTKHISGCTKRCGQRNGLTLPRTNWWSSLQKRLRRHRLQLIVASVTFLPKM